jgi:transcriptional regulator with PAS, ATPase and Fis domain
VQNHAPEQSASERSYPTLREVEDRYIEEVLTAEGHNKLRAARVLGIHPTSLFRRLKKNQEAPDSGKDNNGSK